MAEIVLDRSSPHYEAQLDVMYRKLCQPPKLITFSDLRIWTRDDPPQFVQFQRNDVQNMLLASLCEQHDCDPAKPWELRGMKTNMLKARQQGSSTFWLSIGYQKFYNLDYCQIIILTHRAESTARLWQTVETWEQDCRRNLSWMPKLRYSNRKELVREDTGSSILIATAGMEDIATSGLITDVIRSESALWKAGAESQIVGILGALPEWGNLIEESTARGFNEHKDRWDAQERNRTAYFFPYTDTPEYRTEPPPGFERTPEELKLRSVRILAGVRTDRACTDAEVYWRRLKHLQFLKEGKPEATKQEFPLTPMEAFYASAGAAYYPSEYLNALYDEMQNFPIVEVIQVGDNGFGGRIEIYEEPQNGVEYVIGGDEAEGHNEDDKHDASAGDGFRIDTREQVFSYHGKPDGEHFAYDLDALSRHYQGNEEFSTRAMIIPERTPLGGTTCNKLIDIGANIYRHETGVEGAPERTKYGFPANERTKALRDEALRRQLLLAAHMWETFRDEGMTPSQAALEVGCPVIRSLTAIGELLRYSNLKGGKRGGKGSHDDHCTSISCATWYMENWTNRFDDSDVEHIDEEYWPAYVPAGQRR